MKHNVKIWLQSGTQYLRWAMVCVCSLLILAGPQFVLPVHAGDRADASFRDDTSRWKRSANFVSDRTSGLRRKNRDRKKIQRSRGPASVPVAADNQLLVAFSAGSSDEIIEAVAREHGIKRLDDISIALLEQRIVKFKTATAKHRRLIKVLRKDPRVMSVQPNYLYVLGTGDRSQYAVQTLNVDHMHKFADGTDVRIAMLDGGVNGKHTVFGDLEIEQFDATDGASSKHDGHGTAVASLIAAQTGMKGIVPNPELLSAKTFAYVSKWRRMVGETFHLLQGLDWAVLKQAQVLNMSFAGPKDPLMQTALEKTLKANTVLVAAAGNNGPKAAPVYPAAYDGVLAVTATDHRNRLYRRANRGKYVFVAAPGVNVLSAGRNNGVSRRSGTSLAAAHVTGIVALMLQTVPDANPASIEQRLAETAIDLGVEGKDRSFGHGLINPVELFNPPALTN